MNRFKQPIYPGVGMLNLAGHMRPLTAIKADIMCLAVQHYQGDLTAAARHLGLSPNALYRRSLKLKRALSRT